MSITANIENPKFDYKKSYYDKGCVIWDKCQSCPLPVCLDDGDTWIAEKVRGIFKYAERSKITYDTYMKALEAIINFYTSIALKRRKGGDQC
jgi:hypothetical protein